MVTGTSIEYHNAITSEIAYWHLLVEAIKRDDQNGIKELKDAWVAAYYQVRLLAQSRKHNTLHKGFHRD